MGGKRQSAEDRFNSYMVISDNGCWNWIGPQKNAGYGAIYVDGKNLLVHRWSYERFKGPILEGYEIDHLCRNRACCNPDHLEAVTRTENQRRGYGFSGINHRKTHCPSGHEYTPENTRIYRDRRYCKICKRESMKTK